MAQRNSNNYWNTFHDDSFRLSFLYRRLQGKTVIPKWLWQLSLLEFSPWTMPLGKIFALLAQPAVMTLEID